MFEMGNRLQMRKRDEVIGTRSYLSSTLKYIQSVIFPLFTEFFSYCDFSSSNFTPKSYQKTLTLQTGCAVKYISYTNVQAQTLQEVNYASYFDRNLLFLHS